MKSALTAVNCVQVKSEIVAKIASLSSSLESSSPWPISGGRPVGSPKIPKSDFENVLLTGHEDGSVRIWRLYSNMMSEIAKVTTMKYFNTGKFDLKKKLENSIKF